MKFLPFSQTKLGSYLSLPAHGWVGARATSLFLAAHFAKQKTKFGGGGKARAGKNFYPVGSRSNSFGAFPPTPFLFCPPERQNSASGFSRKKVRILFRTDSQLVKFWFPASLGASPLASADEFSSNFQTSQSFFAQLVHRSFNEGGRANAKRQFSAKKRL